MTDRELLELAAKAAGLAHDGFKGDGLWLVIPSVSEGGDPDYWCPLLDDGMALRLAVTLGIDVSKAQIDYYDKNSNDPYAATRRAIVCASAEVECLVERKSEEYKAKA